MFIAIDCSLFLGLSVVRKKENVLFKEENHDEFFDIIPLWISEYMAVIQPHLLHC